MIKSFLPVCVVLTAIYLIGLLIAEHHWRPGQSRFRVWLMKPMASFWFLMTAVAAGALMSDFGITVFVALAFGALADVLLIPEGNKKAFLAGMGSFLLGHLFYCLAFLRLDISFSYQVMVVAVVMVMVSITVLVWLWPYATGAFRPMLIAYVMTFSVMVTAAMGASQVRHTNMIIVAASLFVVSDIFVARQKFVKSQFINRLISLPLYYVAQLMFAISAADAL